MPPDSSTSSLSSASATAPSSLTPRRPNTANEATQNPQAGTRFISSCNRCRRRKIKCDAGIPSCHACSDSSTICEYRDTTINTDLPRARIIGLEQHLQHLLGQQSQGTSTASNGVNYVNVDGVMQPEFRGRLVVSGIRLACKFCRKRKIKCDGTAPCSGCTKFGRPTECSILYEEASSQGRSYVSYLEDRITKLTQQAATGPARSNHDSSPSNTTASSHYTQPPQPAPSVQDTAYAARYDVEEEPARSLAGESPGHFQRLAHELKTLNEHSAAVLSNQSLHTPWNFRTSILSFIGYKDDTGPYPSPLTRAVVHPLVQHYISKVSPAFPFVLVADITRAQERLHADKASSDEQFMILMVMAIAASHMSEHPSSMASWNALRFFSSASYVARYNPDSLAGLELTLLVIQFATLNPSKAKVWYLSNLAMRTCAHLGLHCTSLQNARDSGSPETPTLGSVDESSQSAMHTRCRLFWAAYAYDRTLSITTGRPFGFDDDIITIPLVPSLPQLQADPSHDLMFQRLSIFTILSEIYTKLYLATPYSATVNMESMIHELEERLAQWTLQNPLIEEPLLDADLSTARVLLYRPCPALPERTAQDLAQLAEASIAYVDRLYDCMHGPIPHYNSHFIITRTYTTGLALMHVCSSPKFDSKSLDGAMLARINLAVSKTTSCLFGATAKWQVGLDLATHFVKIQGPFYAWLNSGGSIELLAEEIRGFAQYREGSLRRNMDDGAPDWDPVMHTLLSTSEQAEKDGKNSVARTSGFHHLSNQPGSQDIQGGSSHEMLRHIEEQIPHHTAQAGSYQERKPSPRFTTIPMSYYEPNRLPNDRLRDPHVVSDQTPPRHLSHQPMLHGARQQSLTPLQQLANTAIGHPASQEGTRMT